MAQDIQLQPRGLWLNVAADPEISRLEGSTEADGDRNSRTLRHTITSAILERYGINTLGEAVEDGEDTTTYSFRHAGSLVRMAHLPTMTQIMTWHESLRPHVREIAERRYITAKMELELDEPGDPEDKFSPLGFLLHHCKRAGIRGFALSGARISWGLPVALRLIELPADEWADIVGPAQALNNGFLEVTQPGRFRDHYSQPGPRRAWRLTGEDRIVRDTA